jgi:sensor c-di-GMP phosphodiesterase-like protein
LWTICLHWFQTLILCISASQIAKIIDMSHQHQADPLCLHPQLLVSAAMKLFILVLPHCWVAPLCFLLCILWASNYDIQMHKQIDEAINRKDMCPKIKLLKNITTKWTRLYFKVLINQ